MASTLSRRDRVRAATVTEIKQTARRILVAEGPSGLSLRAIAREMGMTAPALYRYFASREELIAALIAELYDELTATLVAARDAAGPADPRAGIAAASRAFRSWALAHRREFALLFGSPIPGIPPQPPDTPASPPSPPSPDGRGSAASPGGPASPGSAASLASERFGEVFANLVARIYQDEPFPIPAEEDMDPALRQELRAWCAGSPVGLPLGAAQVFLSCWIRLYGMVAMEVFGHLQFALADAEPLFEAELRDLGITLGFAPTPTA